MEDRHSGDSNDKEMLLYQELLKMDEYSRIIIERYCQTHKTKKAATLSRLVAMSYDLSAEGTDAEGTDYDAIELEKIIAREKNEEMLEALQDLDDFLFGW